MIDIETGQYIKIFDRHKNSYGKYPANPMELLERFASGSFYNTSYYCKTTQSQIQSKVKNNIVLRENINQSATLFFSKGCTFPRYKLEGTTFKRCIKSSKADYLVIPNNIKIANRYTNATVYKYMCKHIAADFRGNGNIQVVYYIDSQSLIDFPQLKEVAIEIDPVSFVTCDTKAEVETILQIRDLDIPFIYEKDLDYIISEKLDKLDEDTILSLYDMLKSEDESSVELGIKLLTSFNVLYTPFTVVFLLQLTRDKWMYNKARNSVAFKNMVQSLRYDIDRGYVGYIFENFYIQNEKDRSLSKMLIEPWLKEAFATCVNVNSLDKIPFKIKFNLEVE